MKMPDHWNDPRYLRYLIARAVEGDTPDDLLAVAEWYIEHEEGADDADTD